MWNTQQMNKRRLDKHSNNRSRVRSTSLRDLMVAGKHTPLKETTVTTLQHKHMNSRAGWKKHLPKRRMSHEPKTQLRQIQTRSDVLDSDLRGQERTLAVLLEQAFRIKEEVSAGLQSTRGSIQVEALSRKLLENHILTITRIVKQLSMDIQALERQMAEQDSNTSGTTLAVRNLDQKNTAGIGDLRGRVARCDAGVAKLSTAMSSLEQQLIRLQQEVAELRSAVDMRLKELEVKLCHDLGKLEASLSQNSRSQKRSMSDLQVKQLEDRMSGEIKEAKEQSDSLRKWTEQQLTTSMQLCTQQQNKMQETSSRLADQLCALEARVKQCETQQNLACHSQADQLKGSETKLSKRITSVESGLHQELQLLKHEYQKGFRSVHDAIESLIQIGDIKSRLDQEKFQQDFRHKGSKAAELDDPL
ncbi:protein FAM81B [Notolabrus celidotus]|uniref:protein FAM81B n=1 Tax=Notolabrus celidotus TaxID=1203425 RepID=UPI001490338A|nr:protein FAM81B [Notolabrus celidotus]